MLVRPGERCPCALRNGIATRRIGHAAPLGAVAGRSSDPDPDRRGRQRRGDFRRRRHVAPQNGDVVVEPDGLARNTAAHRRSGAPHDRRREAANAGSQTAKHHGYRRGDQQGPRADRKAEQHAARAARPGPEVARHRAQRAGRSADGIDRLAKAGAPTGVANQCGVRRGDRLRAEARKGDRERTAKPRRRDLSCRRQPAAGRRSAAARRAAHRADEAGCPVLRGGAAILAIRDGCCRWRHRLGTRGPVEPRARQSGSPDAAG